MAANAAAAKLQVEANPARPSLRTRRTWRFSLRLVRRSGLSTSMALAAVAVRATVARARHRHWHWQVLPPLACAGAAGAVPAPGPGAEPLTSETTGCSLAPARGPAESACRSGLGPGLQLARLKLGDHPADGRGGIMDAAGFRIAAPHHNPRVFHAACDLRFVFWLSIY